jgi:predicted enzyme involved in methoxymalonyl-ACP biosynthesis
VSVRDRFGDYGIVGFFIVEKISSEELFIKDLMFSCRVQGRHIDLFTIQEILKEASENKIGRVKGIVSYNTKNEDAKKTYILTNFKEIENRENECYFEFDLTSQELPNFDYITLE